MLRSIMRTPVVGETLVARFYSSGRVEQYFVEVIEVFEDFAACRVRIQGDRIVRVYTSQLFE